MGWAGELPRDVRGPHLLAFDQGDAELPAALGAPVPDCGLGLSLLLNLRINGINLFRTILYLPSVLSGVAVAVLWIALLNPESARSTSCSATIGIDDPPRWLNSPTWAVPSLVLVGLWGVGGGAIIYLAGCKTSPRQLYEAADIDGAGPRQRFRNITLPLLTPTLFFTLITSLIGAFQVFDIAFIMAAEAGAGAAARCYSTCSTYGMRLPSTGASGTPRRWPGSWCSPPPPVILVILRTSGRWVYYEYDPERER